MSNINENSIKWKGRTYNEIVSIIKSNKNQNQSTQNIFLPNPCKIYRRELPITTFLFNEINANSGNERTSLKIDENPSYTIKNTNNYCDNNIIIQKEYNVYPNIMLKDNITDTTIINSIRRIRSSGMNIEKPIFVSNTKIATKYYTNKCQYLNSTINNDIYNPNNPQFSQQGAVSNSNYILRKTFDTNRNNNKITSATYRLPLLYAETIKNNIGDTNSICAKCKLSNVKTNPKIKEDNIENIINFSLFIDNIETFYTLKLNDNIYNDINILINDLNDNLLNIFANNSILFTLTNNKINIISTTYKIKLYTSNLTYILGYRPNFLKTNLKILDDTVSFSSYSKFSSTIPNNYKTTCCICENRILFASYGYDDLISFASISNGIISALTDTLETTLRDSYKNISVSADGLKAFVACWQGYSYFMDWNGTNYSALIQTLDTNTYGVYNSYMSKDGLMIFMCDQDGQIYFSKWNGTNFNAYTQIFTPNIIRTGPINDIICSLDTTRIIYNFENGETYYSDWNGYTYNNETKLPVYRIWNGYGYTYNNETYKGVYKFLDDTNNLIYINYFKIISYILWDADKNIYANESNVISLFINISDKTPSYIEILGNIKFFESINNNLYIRTNNGTKVYKFKMRYNKYYLISSTSPYTFQ